jgi:nucleotide-binding universal stress UspA family protein
MAHEFVPEVTVSPERSPPPSVHDEDVSGHARPGSRPHQEGRVNALSDSRPAPGLRAGAAVRRILLATDLSPASDAATSKAIEMARDLGAHLLIISVIDPAVRGVPGGRVERMDQRRAAREFAAQAAVVRGRQAGVTVNFLVWEGEPGPAIVEAATAEDADLVIVGSHGRGRVGRFLIGSVSDHVIRHATAPVLVVRG